ncbi:MAG: hypothetical protein ABIR39_22865, partial [Nocardioides sp.]
TTPPTTTPPTTTPPTTTPPTTTPPTTTPPTTTPPTTTPPTPPVTVSATEPTPSTEVQGEQGNEDDTKDKDKSTPDVEVLGEQAAVPTTVAAGLSGDVSQASSSGSSLWMAGMTGLLALAIGLGLVSSRRLRGRA